jgi:penicillin-binding protein 1A
MAARGRSDRRVEPSFDSSQDDEEFRLDADDRIIGNRKGSKRARSEDVEDSRAPEKKRTRKPSAKAAPRRGRQAPSGGGGLFAPLRSLFYWCIVLGIWGAIGIGGLVLYYGAQMPAASTWAIPDRPPNMKITAIDGSVIANRGTTGGEALALEQMSPYLPQAVISIEDRRFYSHFGIDPFGLARAFVNNMTGQPIQGGSTITQQLAKNLFLSPERTFERKIQEVLLSFWLEHRFSKDQILAMYLNRVYFGANAYGVEAASRRYFNKSAQDVSLGEAATLAGLLKAPSRLSPARDPKAAEERAQVVLGTMRQEGYITDSDYKTAMAQPPAKAKSYWSGPQHYAADMVVDEVKGLIGDPKVDVVVETTIDTRLEEAADKALNDILEAEGGKLNASQAALVSVDATGAVRAVVGGRDYAESQFNRAFKAKRQPGSAFKPFVYAAALEAGYRPDTMVNDAPFRIGNWSPENYDQKFRGPVTLASAMAQSLNTVAAQLIAQVGPDAVVSMAHRLGIESDLQSNASIALGTSEVSLVELTSAYASFMNGGFKATPYTVKRITDMEGKVLYEADYSNPPRVLSEPVAATMNSMMNGVMNEGTGKAARLSGWQAAGKSGTTQSFRDALFVGYTSIMTTGIWFGNDDGSFMKKVTGGGLPAKAWQEYMTTAMHGYSPTPLFGFNSDLQLPQPGSDQQSPSTTIGDIISGILPGGSQQPDEGGMVDEFPPAPMSPQQPMPPRVPETIPGRAETFPEQQAPRRGGNEPYPQPSRDIPCPYGDNAVCGNGNGGMVENAPPQRDYRNGGDYRAQQGGGYRDYREYRGPYDAGGPVPPGDIGGGPMPPSEVGQVYQPQQTRRTTLFDVIMGQ